MMSGETDDTVRAGNNPKPVPVPDEPTVATEADAVGVHRDTHERTVTVEDPLRGYYCCSYPHGEYSFLPAILVTVAFFLSVSAHKWCEFVSREVIASTGTGTSTFQGMTVGFWSYQGQGVNEGVCFQYPDDFPIDSFTRSARAFGVLAAIIGGICMIILWFSACIAMEVWQWRVVSGFILLSCFFEGLTFLMFNSNLCNTLCYEMVDIQSKCSLAWGARTAIAALVFWFVAGVSTWFMPVAQPIDPIVIRKKTVKTEKTSPDGTKTITTETFSTSV